MTRTAAPWGSFLICLGTYAAALLAALLAARLAAPLLPRWVAGFRPLALALVADLAATLLVFAFSVACDNSSLYDPYWSLAPALLALYWLQAYGGWPALTARQAVVLCLVVAWALRLTWNWARRWRGLSDEDWRYAGFRRRFGRAYWAVSFGGIHLFPTLIVFLGCLSLHEVLQVAPPGDPATTRMLAGLSPLDLPAGLITAGAILIEAAADRQLRRFRRQGGRGVFTGGLWGLCRHPNYLGEVLFWWGLYLFCLAAAPRSWWAVLGPVAMTTMFLTVSVPLMDRHLAGRQRGYDRGAGRLPALLPAIRLRRNPAPRHGRTAGRG